MENIPKKGLLGLIENWRNDLIAAVSVSLIALPLSLGIALAVGAPAMAGIISAIVGGVVTTLYRGGHISVNGPAKGVIAVILLGIALMDDGTGQAFNYVLAAVVVSGAIQVLLGLLKLGRLADIFHSSVIHGILAAIGIIIFAKQIHVALGTHSDSKSIIQNLVDAVVYLPLDTQTNAEKFIKAVHPELVIFVKYEIWPNYLLEIKKRQIDAVLISALFRKNQSFFKSSGKWMQKALFAFNHIFVQNEESKELLNDIGYNNVTVSGDTRFDRVSNQLKINNKLNFIETFKQDNLCVVAGSTWQEGEAMLTEFINNDTSNTKYIIAPHNIKSGQILSFKNRFKKSVVLYSEKDTADVSEANVLIIDTIGILSKIYSYADVAYVGGALGTTGLHNTLEPAVFGVPIIIGHNHEKFPEAQSMIDNKGMFSIKIQTEFNTILNQLIKNDDFRNTTGKLNANFILKNKGAVASIMAYLNKR